MCVVYFYIDYYDFVYTYIYIYIYIYTHIYRWFEISLCMRVQIFKFTLFIGSLYSNMPSDWSMQVIFSSKLLRNRTLFTAPSLQSALCCILRERPLHKIFRRPHTLSRSRRAYSANISPWIENKATNQTSFPYLALECWWKPSHSYISSSCSLTTLPLFFLVRSLLFFSAQFIVLQCAVYCSS